MNWTDWRGEVEKSRELMFSIIALLLSLDSLADSAASLSWRRRQHLLQILRNGEASGQRCVLRLAQDIGALSDDFAMPRAGDGFCDDDAVGMARRFRAMAFMLAFLLVAGDVLGQTAGATTGSALAPAISPMHSSRSLQVGLPIKPPDTS